MNTNYECNTDRFNQCGFWKCGGVSPEWDVRQARVQNAIHMRVMACALHPFGSLAQALHSRIETRSAAQPFAPPSADPIYTDLGSHSLDADVFVRISELVMEPRVMCMIACLHCYCPRSFDIDTGSYGSAKVIPSPPFLQNVVLFMRCIGWSQSNCRHGIYHRASVCGGPKPPLLSLCYLRDWSTHGRGANDGFGALSFRLFLIPPVAIIY